MSTSIYDEKYHLKFLDRASTVVGKKIYECRWNLVQKYCHGEMRLLDYGCASGAFHKSSPNGFVTMGYDINPHCGYSVLPSGQVDILTMWDSLEHVLSPAELIKQLNPNWLFLSTPNLESVRGDIRQWRHYRPGEHLYYFDLFSLTEILEYCGYQILEHNFDEGDLRDPSNPKAIISMVAKRK
jgi:2-polyprenyl-3-methyl-5-hydroxy-6-metoxy-1,4-benzoquinol methylase